MVSSIGEKRGRAAFQPDGGGLSGAAPGAQALAESKPNYVLLAAAILCKSVSAWRRDKQKPGRTVIGPERECLHPHGDMAARSGRHGSSTRRRR